MKNKFLYLRKAFAGKANIVKYSTWGIPMAYHYFDLVCWYQGMEDKCVIKRKESFYNWDERLQKALYNY